MSKPSKKVLGVMEILKEAINLSIDSRKLIFSVTFLFLLPCHLLLLAVTALNPIPLRLNPTSLLPFKIQLELSKEIKSTLEVEPISEALWWLLNTVAICLLSKAYNQKSSSLLELLLALKREWKKILITSLYGELIMVTCSFLLLALNYSQQNSMYKNVTSFAILTTISKFLAMVMAFVIFVFVNLACQLSFVISMLEEGCSGIAALRCAAEIIKGRKLQSFILMIVLILVEQVIMDEESEKKESTLSRIAVRAFVNVPIELVLQLFGCSLYRVLYLEGKKRERRREEGERNV